MRKIIFFGILVLSLLLSACGGNVDMGGKSDNGTGNGNPNVEEELPYIGFPTVTVFLVPMDGITAVEINKLKVDFEKNFCSRRAEPYIVEVLDHMKTPDSCYNGMRSRFRAEKMIKALCNKYLQTAMKKAEANFPESYEYHIIGVSNKDISTSVHNQNDYGILGLSYRGSTNYPASVVSTFRLKRNKDLWKLAAHELCHGLYWCGHCKNDDPHCLMADAKGGDPHFEIKENLCSECGVLCVFD